MPFRSPFVTRRTADLETVEMAKMVVAELTKANMIEALPTGAKLTGLAEYLGATMEPRSAGADSYYEAAPWTDPDVPFGPGRPIAASPIDPLSPDGGIEPRTYEGPIAWNINYARARHLGFDILRKAADTDLVRRCIEIRKADIVGLEWDIVLDDRAVRAAQAKARATKPSDRVVIAQAMRQSFDSQITALKSYWETPDRLNGYDMADWLNMALEEQLVSDALSIYPHPTLGGPVVDGLAATTHSLRIIDGATIKPLYDHLYNTPQPPMPAYQQILYGFPRGEFTYDPAARGNLTQRTLLYRPRNRRVTSPYGLPVVEQALSYIDIWLKRLDWIRAEYGVGTTPDFWLRPIPGSDVEWSPDKRQRAERRLNHDLSGNTRERHLIHLMPPGLEPVEVLQFAEKYRPEFDDMLALRLAAFFDVMGTQLNITPKGGLGGKGHQEGESAKSEAQARQPTTNYLVDLLNTLSRRFLGAPPEVTFAFRSEDEDDLAEITASRQTELFSGQQTLNGILAEAGRPLMEFAEADMPFVVAPGIGITFLEGASVKPEPSPVMVAPGFGAPSSPKVKAAEIAAYAKFTAKGPRTREFVWKHLGPDEIKAVEATIPKARARKLPGQAMRSAIEAHYGPLIAKAARATGIRETVERSVLHRDAAKTTTRAGVTEAQAEGARLAVVAGVILDKEALTATLTQLYGDAGLAGAYVAQGQLGGGAVLGAGLQDMAIGVDWSSWTPGYGAAAAKVASGGLGTLVNNAGVTISGITESMMNDLGAVLANGLAEGSSAKTIASVMTDLLGDADRAELVAVTETARAMTAAAFDTYGANGATGWNLLTVADACQVCLDVESDNPHDMSDQGDGAPVHPRCRCAVAPVVDTGAGK